MNRRVKFIDLGLIDYRNGWDYQERHFKDVINKKILNRSRQDADKEFTGNYLIFCEHPHVVTMGKSGDSKNILLSEEQLKSKNIEFYKVNRGGDVTYHGPGQIVVYPILNLDYFFTDIHRYMRTLEEAVILTLSEYGIKGERLNGVTGVWIGATHPFKARKICAMGVRSSHWVTMHGIAFNVNSNLNYFNTIIPCGIQNKGVTSMTMELGYSPRIEEVKEKLKNNFAKVFEFQYIESKNTKHSFCAI
jgi:lipoyl(octanoyl) transferase